jgi:hypothetical protein
MIIGIAGPAGSPVLKVVLIQSPTHSDSSDQSRQSKPAPVIAASSSSGGTTWLSVPSIDHGSGQGTDAVLVRQTSQIPNWPPSARRSAMARYQLALSAMFICTCILIAAV